MISHQVISKEVQLPTDSVMLTAFAVPERPKDGPDPYAYEWRLVSYTKPNGKTATQGEMADAGNMKNSHSQQLQLSDLEQGGYQVMTMVLSCSCRNEKNQDSFLFSSR